MTGNCNVVAQVFHLFMDMDKMIGGQFEKELAGIKLIAEGGSKS